MQQGVIITRQDTKNIFRLNSWWWWGGGEKDQLSLNPKIEEFFERFSISLNPSTKQLHSHEALTSALMICQRFEEIKGRCGSILNGQILPQAGWVR